MTKAHLLLALIMSVIFGAGWVFGKAALDHFSPTLTAAFRFGIAGVLIVCSFGWPVAPRLQIAIVSSCALALPYSLSYVGLRYLDVSTTVLLVQLEAPILITLSIFLLGERPSRQVLAGILLSLIGISVVVGAPSIQGAYGPVILVVVSMMIWAFGQIQLRRFESSEGGLRLLGAACLAAAPQLVLLSLLFEEQHVKQIVTAGGLEWVQIGYLSLGMTVAGQGIWFHLVRQHRMDAVAPFLLLVPVFSIVGATIFLDERPDLNAIIGGGLVLLGVAAATRPPNMVKNSDPNLQKSPESTSG